MRLALIAIWVPTMALVIHPQFVLAQGGRVNVTRAAELFPLETGNYLDYDSYVTDTNGVADPSTLTHAASSVVSTGLDFDGASGVAIVSDTATATGAVSNVRYMANSEGDIMVFADQNFISLFAPSSVANKVTPPDSFVTYVALSNGTNHTYPILALSQPYNASGLLLTMNLMMTGAFRGVESLDVPSGHYDSAYHFTISADLKAMSSSIILAELTNAEELWLVPGVGIVKTDMPEAKSPFFTVQGSERVMIAHANQDTIVVKTASVANSPSTSGMAVYPNPANVSATVHFASASTNQSVRVYSVTGRLIENIPSIHGADVRIDTRSIPDGDYFVVTSQAGSTPQATRLAVVH